MKKKWLTNLLLLGYTLIAFVTGCREKTPYDGYSSTNNGLYYKVIALGDNFRKPQKGDFLQLSITYMTTSDSIFLDTYTYNETGKVILPYNNASFIGSFEEGIRKMNEGDTYSFIVPADSLFLNFFKTPIPTFLKEGDMVKLDITLHAILSQKKTQEEIQKFNTEKSKRVELEAEKLKLFLDTSSFNFSNNNDLLYFRIIKQGTGSSVKKGDEITIHYTGYFLNGVPFESTYKHNQPMKFSFGQEGQVIKGLEKAISLMNEGTKAKFIIPSQLAFGATGSSSGIVPPYTTVIYEIELLACNRHL